MLPLPFWLPPSVITTLSVLLEKRPRTNCTSHQICMQLELYLTSATLILLGNLEFQPVRELHWRKEECAGNLICPSLVVRKLSRTQGRGSGPLVLLKGLSRYIWGNGQLIGSESLIIPQNLAGHHRGCLEEALCRWVAKHATAYNRWNT